MNPNLFQEDSGDEEFMGIMSDCVDLLEKGETSGRPRIPHTVIRRDRETADEQLMADYFVKDAKYTLWYFRRRFRMLRPLFMRIVNDILSYPSRHPGHVPEHFRRMQDKLLDGRKRVGFSTIKKCVSAIRQLAYGYNPGALDDYLQIGEGTSRVYLDHYSKCVFQLYKEEYLRRPTPEDIDRLYDKYEELHGFPRMLGSIDCMHWPWKNCPKAWQGQYTRGDHDHPTIMLEAVASYDLWIWHAYFGTAGSNNDINVLNNSPVFREIIEDRAQDSSFKVNGTHYRKWYYLRSSQCLLSRTHARKKKRRKKFKQYQESARKDVERAFRSLQNQWHILTQPARAKSINRICRTKYACVILHNMIVEGSSHTISTLEEDGLIQPPTFQRTFEERMAVHERTNKELRDRHVHHALRHDLTEHILRLPSS
uniref:uncharacterized protein LOC122597428 n=1 Tax=Erigeron canadensis TaxID=72917 RepID=UPI001CB8E407|nr:uncharacterized protein LOC122597428 [Erigeron canadensis]